MIYLLAYDISSGSKTLNKIAKICENYGVRVQNSLFELNLYQKDLINLIDQLNGFLDEKKDSIRIYEIGKNVQNKIRILGKCGRIELANDEFFML